MRGREACLADHECGCPFPQVFYGERSIVFPEAENRRWTIQALVDRMFGRWEL